MPSTDNARPIMKEPRPITDKHDWPRITKGWLLSNFRSAAQTNPTGLAWPSRRPRKFFLAIVPLSVISKPSQAVWSHFLNDRYSQTSASSRARASIWFLAACSLSAVDRLSGGPSIPTFTRPDSSPRDEENVNVNEPRPSGSNRIVSTLHTPPLRQTYALRLCFECHRDSRTATVHSRCELQCAT